MIIVTSFSKVTKDLHIAKFIVSYLLSLWKIFLEAFREVGHSLLEIYSFWESSFLGLSDCILLVFFLSLGYFFPVSFAKHTSSRLFSEGWHLQSIMSNASLQRISSGFKSWEVFPHWWFLEIYSSTIYNLWLLDFYTYVPNCLTPPFWDLIGISNVAHPKWNDPLNLFFFLQWSN